MAFLASRDINSHNHFFGPPQLEIFMQQKTLSSCQAGWASFLSNLNFNISHTPGHYNPADAASWRVGYVDTSTYANFPLLSLSNYGSLNITNLSPIHLPESHIPINPPEKFFVCPIQQNLCTNYNTPFHLITKDN
ncbi:hypothetical protein O181_061497 [Austropuccinia psidii MF-1]|uniref:Uncharacterized protein n=1 Tax=Austropuccinia psidii MF-1 TaxID=1389203 RepID=A0A9Q3EKS5_9BASI|nr:hypothetical protein [Austropuccinia psidii MF-1]